jgi:hypothetical protein
MRDFTAVVWSALESAGVRDVFSAVDLEDAKQQLTDKYGEQATYTLYNEEEAEAQRHVSKTRGGGHAA